MVSARIFFVILVYIFNVLRDVYWKPNRFFKGFRRKEISVADIYAIKIEESVTWTANYTGIGLRDKQGNKLYTKILVKRSPNKNSDLLEDLKTTDLGDYRFMMRNERCVLGSCVYDQSAIDYLLTLNPNIMVFYP